MKRSEMIKIISKFSYEYAGKDGDFAELLLNEIENAGMLPPNTYLTNEPDYTWEAEDE